MNANIYWKIRGICLRIVTKINNLLYRMYEYRVTLDENRSFEKMILNRTFINIVKSVCLVTIFHNIDVILMKYFELPQISTTIIVDIVIAEIGVSGVILGLYCSNVSSIYSSKYSAVHPRITSAFQNDRCTLKSMDSIVGFIIYASVLLVKLIFVNGKTNGIGWLSLGILFVWALKVLISYRVVGNRTYQLSNVFNISDDAYVRLQKIVLKYLNNEIYTLDEKFQKNVYDQANSKLLIIKAIQKYGCNDNNDNNASICKFMISNIELIKKYWEVKKYVPRNSWWFRKKNRYNHWHNASSFEISGSLQAKVPIGFVEDIDYNWFETELMLVNRGCISNLLDKREYECLYEYFVQFNSLCKTSIEKEEFKNYVSEIEWYRNNIIILIDEEKIKDDGSFVLLIDNLSMILSSVLSEVNNYITNINIVNIYDLMITPIDLGNPINKIREIRGSDNVNLYNKIALEVKIEGRRITPDWVIKQILAKKYMLYMNLLIKLIGEEMEHLYLLGNKFFDKSMYEEACIIFLRFYEYEIKIKGLYRCINDKYEELTKFHVDVNDAWEENGAEALINKFIQKKKALPNLLRKCTIEVGVKNWNCIKEKPDYLGEAFNFILEDAVDAIVDNDREQYKAAFENITKMMVVYQEYIRKDLSERNEKSVDINRCFAFTAPIVEWAQIGGLGILYGEMVEDINWNQVVEDSFKILLNDKKMIETFVGYAKMRDRIMLCYGQRWNIEYSWQQKVVQKMREETTLKFEYDRISYRYKTQSKLINAFCPNIMDRMFNHNPSEVFWVICVNKFLREDKKYKTHDNWEGQLNGEE